MEQQPHICNKNCAIAVKDVYVLSHTSTLLEDWQINTRSHKKFLIQMWCFFVGFGIKLGVGSDNINNQRVCTLLFGV